MVWLLILPIVILWLRVSTLSSENKYLHKLLRDLTARVEKLSAALKAGVQATTEQPLREKAATPARAPIPAPTPIPARAEAVPSSVLTANRGRSAESPPKPVAPAAPAPGKVPEPIPFDWDIAFPRGLDKSPALPTPGTTPKPVEAQRLIEALKPVETPKPVEASKPAETPKPVAPPKPVEIPKPVAPPKPAEAPTHTAAPKPYTPPRPAAPPKPYIPPPPVVPALPTFVERAFVAAKDWLLGGNTVVRLGLVLLFIGLAFLLRYASEQYTLPVEYRYIGVALAAVVLLVLGWRLRLKKPAYGLTLQGAGIAVLYLTSFAAMRLHGLLPSPAVFGVLVLLTAGAALLAILQDAISLATAAALGGFIAPILASSGSGDHVALFSYFALLNTGILAIAWFKAWRALNLIGFAGTFCIGFAWGMRDPSGYTPELFASTEPFLILFFLMYVGIGLLFARRKLLEAANAPEDKGRRAMLRWSASNTDYLDGTMMFGPPLIGFGLQCAIIGHIEFGMAFSALGLGLFYLALALLLRSRPRVSLLMEICLSLGVVFGTLAIPLAFESQWHLTSAAWAVEGAGIYWLSLKQRRQLARAFSLLLIVVAAIAWFSGLETLDHQHLTPLLAHDSPLGAALLGVALLFCHYTFRHSPPDALREWDQPWQRVFAVAGLVFLYLIPPLYLKLEYTVIAWTLAGAATFFSGLFLGSRAFLFCASGVFVAAAFGWLTSLSLGQDIPALLAGSRPGAVVLGVTLLGTQLLSCLYILRREPKAVLADWLRSCLPVFAVAGLVFLYLLAPLSFALEYTVVAWALAGVATLFAGLSLRSRAYLGSAFGVLAAGAIGWLRELGPGTDTLLQAPPLAAALLGVALLACHFTLRRSKQAALTDWVRPGLPVFAIAGLVFLYLLAPLFFGLEFTVVAWALAGMVTLFAGLRLDSRPFIACAFGVQLLAGLFFLCNLKPGGPDEVLGSGWMGVLSAALVGFSLIASTIVTQNDAARRNKALAGHLSLALLTGLVFVNLALLFVLNWGEIALAWAASGLLILWLGLWQRQKQSAMFYFGLALEAVAGITLIFNNVGGQTPSNPWASTALALAAMCGAWRMHHIASRQPERPSVLDPRRIAALSSLLLVWGVSWWVWTVADRILMVARELALVPDVVGALILLALSLSGLLWLGVARLAQWRELALASLLPLVTAVWVLATQGVPPEWMVILAWGVFFVTHFILLRALANVLPVIVQGWVHVIGVWLLVGVSALAAYNATGDLVAASAWRWLALALPPSLYLWLAGSGRGQFWPLRNFAREYRLKAALPMLLAMLFWFWNANLSEGVSAPLPYVPLVNPLEVGLLLVLLACWNWSRARLPELGSDPRSVKRATTIVGGGLLFALAMLAVCRGVHFWGGVDFNPQALKGSMSVQAGWSLVGTLYALALMIVGTLRRSRSMWLVGAALVALVVLKLFFVELSGHGSLARIVSFIGVGVLLLIVGYFSPLPPRRQAGEDA